jgi:RecJ-like exonuclease
MGKQCGKCSGTGKIESFSHIAGGICFWCKGTGRLSIKASRGAAVAQAPKRASIDINVDGEAISLVRMDTPGEVSVAKSGPSSNPFGASVLGTMWLLRSAPRFSDGLNFLSKDQKMNLAYEARRQWGTA